MSFSFIDLLRTLERITRPLSHDDDPPAEEFLSEGADPRECRAPGPFDCLRCGLHCRWPTDRGDALGPYEAREDFADDTPNPAEWSDDERAAVEAMLRDIPAGPPNPMEPGLDDDELVAVRQLIEERFPLWDRFQSSAPVKSTPGTGAEPDRAPVFTADDAGADPAGDGNLQASPPAGPIPTTAARFAAADWLEKCLHTSGVEAGSGWVLALVDGVLERANPPAPQPMETGLDMGARLDGATELFPQHRKTQQ